MKVRALIGTLLFTLFFVSPVAAQTFARTPAPGASPSAEAAQLQALVKKIDEQNAKIDVLSQQILKLEQQLASSRPGVIIGEATPAAPAPAAAATDSSHATGAPAASGNTHTVARGETLTSIAKAYGVTVLELQKWNHIDDARKLQMGQTIMISAPASPAPAPADGE